MFVSNTRTYVAFYTRIKYHQTMIDTVKFSFPVTNVKNTQLYLLQGYTKGEKTFELHKSYFSIGSYEYRINFTIINSICYLEFSVPKILKGYNVGDDDISFSELSEVVVSIASELRQVFDCPEVGEWVVTRLDLSSNYYHKQADLLLTRLNRIEIPRKKKSFYGSSIMFVGLTYTIKYYLKQPEFKVHDMARIARKSPNLANHLFNRCENILRFELTIRKQALSRFYHTKTLTLSQLLSDNLPMELKTLFKNGTKRLQNIEMDNSTLRERLILKYGKIKGNRLYFFHVSMSSSLSRKLLLNTVNRTTIYRNTKLIEAIDD